MRIAVTGRHGQVARALVEQAPVAGAEIVTLARPEFDLLRPDNAVSLLKTASADIVIAAAAYTAVDLAEKELDAAHAANATAAAAVADAARALSIPVIYISTDYVFDGSLDRSYREDDPPKPINAYGRSKYDGEQAVAKANPDHANIRTAWVYSPFGKNFLRTMLSLAAARDEVSVVADQIGSPTSASDIADGLLKVSRNLLARPADAQLRGVFHMTGSGEASWAQFAESIFQASAALGGASARVIPIPTSAYPTPARRPANSRLDGGKIARIHDVVLPDWRNSVVSVVRRLIADGKLKSDGTAGAQQ